MRLIKYRINKFRSVKGTDWIDIDHWACFVGLNESGKTNLLLPLWKFNPADKAATIDLLPDYPRDEYSELNDDRKSEPFIQVLFEIEDTEIEKFEINFAKNQNDKLEKREEDSLPALTTRKEKYGFKKHLLIEKDYYEHFYIYLSNENGEKESNEIEPDVGAELFNEICDALPRFVYYSEYGNLDSDLYLPRVRDDLRNIQKLSGKDRMKARTLKILFGHVNLEPDEILTLGQESNSNNAGTSKTEDLITKESRNKQERFAKVTSAASRLTTQFNEWWTQGNYVFHFNADGEYFRIFVSDNERPSPIELESRSKGLQWFFSFFLVFLAESEANHRNCILLLDEPGLSLHPNAQTDLIRFFNQLSEKNQLIYTTHLPFLVDHNNLDKVKAVFTENGLTKISNDLSKADKEKKAIQPVNAAIGITASQSLLVGCDIVIVEGVSDQFYLTMIKNHLVSKNKFGFAREMVFIPVKGASGIKPVVSILQGRNNDLPFVLLDSDKTGKEFQTNLRNGFYNGNKDKIIETDTFTGKIGSEIEDLIPLELLIDCFDRLFRTDYGLNTEDINENKPLVPQFEKFSDDNQLDLKNQPGWKVELSKRVKQRFNGNITEKMEEKWINLFKSLHS